YTTISRETGIPITTVRYILKEKLPKLGFTVHPAINYGKLGLQWYLAIIQPSVRPDNFVNILDLFGQTMYLKYYTYLLDNMKFLTLFSIPPRFESSFITFLDQLVNVGLIRKYNVKVLLYRRIIPLRIDCFDFNNGVWIQKWDEMPRTEGTPEIYEVPAQIDGLSSLDLKILAELDKNAFTKYSDIARKLNVTRQTVKRHYEKVLQVIYFYMPFWMPTEYPELVCIPVCIHAKSNDKIREIILNIPFAHLEMKTEDAEYYSILFIPSVGFYKVLKYIYEKGISGEISFLSMEYSANFVPPHVLFKDKEGWVNIFEEGLQKILKEVRLTF
ncbi:MAG: winged helix-turn-helix domain-containing protein, partial [Thaumarchaeota archaeon]|nr:winged helix-turn-helix domain-containing protein [Candidatus Geocrenenecus arthurdayi]